MKDIIIIDDDYYKTEYMKNELSRTYNNSQIYTYSNQEYALSHIDLYRDSIDLLVLDWTFPMREGENPKYAQGLEVLKYLKQNHIDIKTIIFSCDDIELTEKFNNVVAIIQYCPYTSLESEIQEIFKKEMVREKKREKRLMRRLYYTGYKRKKSSEPWWK